MLVKDIMTKNVITVKKDASIREIAQTIVDHDISGLPVVDEEGKVCGIVSEGDLVRKEFAPELPDELCILGAVIYYSGLREYQDAFRKIAAISAEQLMTKKSSRYMKTMMSARSLKSCMINMSSACRCSTEKNICSVLSAAVTLSR